jgi:uncharacterized protein YndB with AHSA1/START domain
VDPISVSTTVKLPREEVFEYLADMANHAEFTDHYLVDWRLTREDSYGAGAGARFRVKTPINGRFAWGDMTFAEVRPPFRIVERGRGGKFNRVKMLGTYELVEDAHDAQSCQVTYTYESDPQVPSDRLAEFFGGRSWTRRQAAKAMRRLRSILEDGTRRGAKPTVAGG